MIWDEAKRQLVISEHKIDFAKLLDIFDDVYAVDFQDLQHSTSEEIHYKIIGMTAQYGLICLVYTIRNDQDRFITAWNAD